MRCAGQLKRQVKFSGRFRRRLGQRRQAGHIDLSEGDAQILSAAQAEDPCGSDLLRRIVARGGESQIAQGVAIRFDGQPHGVAAAVPVLAADGDIRRRDSDAEEGVLNHMQIQRRGQ